MNWGTWTHRQAAHRADHERPADVTKVRERLSTGSRSHRTELQVRLPVAGAHAG